ncbi:hypothetical protein FOS14_01015 [Skermania sp. ID1734]|nr:hypothetical protein FOS14_01015 [Skermania sp. ID1734]
MSLFARAAAIGSAALIPLAAAPGAGATTTDFTQTQTLANGALICGGNIRVWATTSPDWPDKAILNMQSGPLIGFGGPYPFAPVCNVPVNVDWRNLDTGATGRWSVNVVAGMYGSIQYALYQPTGTGHITATVTTGSLNIPGHGDFTVP